MFIVVSANEGRRIGRKYASVNEARREFEKEDKNTYKVRLGAGSAIIYSEDFVAAELREK